VYFEKGGVECGGNLPVRNRQAGRAGGETFCRIESSTGWGEVETVISVDMIRWASNWNDLATLIWSIGRADNRIDMNRKTAWALAIRKMIGR
jgi:hypothetical protein